MSFHAQLLRSGGLPDLLGLGPVADVRGLQLVPGLCACVGRPVLEPVFGLCACVVLYKGSSWGTNGWLGDRLGACLIPNLFLLGVGGVCDYLSFGADEAHALKTMYSLFSRSTKDIIQVKEKQGCNPLTQTKKSNDDCSKAL